MRVASRTIAQAAPTRGGKYTLVQFYDEFYLLYSIEGMTEADLNNKILMFKQEVTAPARLAGGILLVHETLNQVKEHRSAWLYNPGQRRVRRAPNVAYDNPGTAADGMRTSDQFDMFNGAVDRYDWELVGKKEMYVPYNSYKLHSDKVEVKEILTPLHTNPDLARYELHRVWVVDATLREGARHIYKRRTFYVDEDSWQIVAMDQYDNRDQLWRVSEGHVINYYDLPTYLDHARGAHRPAGGPLPGHRTRQPESDVQVRHQSHHGGLHSRGAAALGRALALDLAGDGVGRVRSAPSPCFEDWGD